MKFYRLSIAFAPFQDQNRCFDEMKRVVKPNGKMIILEVQIQDLERG
ncbi:methyltransferase domain-containing protein [Nitrososphaera sp. AFS]|nr:methyltransferase domain-containing protein [Nitrososphaera sp. AFS]